MRQVRLERAVALYLALLAVAIAQPALAGVRSVSGTVSEVDVDNKIVTVDEIQRLAKLPPRNQLLVELAGGLEAPMAALVSALEGKLQEMSGLLEALREQKEGEGAQPPDPEIEN